MSASSEGGLFEYGRDEDILAVLGFLSACPSTSTMITGSSLLERETIDPTIPARANPWDTLRVYPYKEPVDREREVRPCSATI